MAARALSKENLELVLMQAMMAAKNVRTQRDRLLELQRRMLRHQAAAAPTPADAKLGELASDIIKVYFHGLDAGVRMLSVCIKTAVENRAVSTVNLAFALLPDEQLYGALLAQRLPARPTTQAQAIARVESALLSVQMLGEHHLPRCVECLVGGHAPVRGKPDDPSPNSSPDRYDGMAADAVTKVDLSDDPDATATAVTEGLGKLDLSDDPDATATAIAKTGSKPIQAASSDVEKALDYLHRANRITILAVKHIELAVAVLSRFVDPKKLASLTETTDRWAYLGVEISQPTTSTDPSAE